MDKEQGVEQLLEWNGMRAGQDVIVQGKGAAKIAYFGKFEDGHVAVAVKYPNSSNIGMVCFGLIKGAEKERGA